jgi:hypothetical protein
MGNYNELGNIGNGVHTGALEINDLMDALDAENDTNIVGTEEY